MIAHKIQTNKRRKKNNETDKLIFNKLISNNKKK